ncbi:MAG: RluA family pseudouridine synthase [Candidatus Peribacteraceae bacterium]|nr:RluA family pseudouridine synthase [Candidatus Peribacteraceae bacterium]
MAYFHFTIENKNSIRLDKFLAQELPQFSRSFLAKCVLLVNSKKAKPAQKVSAGDLVELKVPPLKDLKIEPEKIPLKIIFEDSEVLVIDKPSGMVVHPTDHGGHVSGTLVNAVLFYLGESPRSAKLRDAKKPLLRTPLYERGAFRWGIVHRLDRETSGCLVVAKTESAKTFLAKEFSERRVEKFYLALLAGRLKTPKGRIDSPLGRSASDRTRRTISTAADAREAITEFEVLESFAEATLVRVKILTGRTHQIRVHFQALGHPVVGDTTYSSKKVQEKLAAPRMFLHAAELKFHHPKTKKLVAVEAPLPEELKKYLSTLKR